jgi:hypothetical protein
MPGKQKKIQGDKNSEVSQSSQDNSGNPTGEPVQDTHTADFTKALVSALKDPEVIKGFENIFIPMIAKHVDEIVKPMIDTQIRENMRECETRILDVEAKLGEVAVDLALVNESLDTQKNKLSSSMDPLISRLNDIERAARGRNLRIFGLEPAEPSDGTDVHEKYNLAFNEMIQEARIEGISASDVVEYVKINSPSNRGPNNTVLLKFSCEYKRDKLYYQKKKLKNCRKKYFINEDLTKQDSNLFKKTRMEVKNGVLAACWTKGGVTWAKSTPEGKPFIVPM